MHMSQSKARLAIQTVDQVLMERQLSIYQDVALVRIQMLAVIRTVNHGCH